MTGGDVFDEPIDPDLEPEAERHRPDVLIAIAFGGAIGALARYEVGLQWPARSGAFPTTTFLVNSSGALLIGLLMVLIVERWASPRLARPFLCIGLLGAWTTMSTFVTEADLLVRNGSTLTALAYVVATIVTGLAATGIGIVCARRLARVAT
jgi:CrcB protein